MAILIRTEHPHDADDIDTVVGAAFVPERGGPAEAAAEAKLVRALRGDGDLALSLVAEQSGLIVGHIGFVRIEIEPDPRLRVWGLAPLSVAPDWQSQGIGGALIRDGLERARRAGVGLVLVLGSPDFYRRFGFSAENALGIEVPWQGPNFMGLILRDTRPPRGRAIYPGAFAALGV
jgi:putative acetyltransferase